MANPNVRYTERSYMSLLLERDPEFYGDRKRLTAYEFSNGRKFIAPEPYTPPVEAD